MLTPGDVNIYSTPLFFVVWTSWSFWNQQKARSGFPEVSPTFLRDLVGLSYIGDDELPIYIGIILNLKHDKDIPIESTSILWKVCR